MLALSLAFFRVSFVLSLPWFSGLILGAGWFQSFRVLRAHWVPCCASVWACAPVGVAWFGALSGMGMHGWHQGIWAARGSLYLRWVRQKVSAMYMIRVQEVFNLSSNAR